LKDWLEWQRVAHPNDLVAEDVNLTELEDVDAAEEVFLLDNDRQIVPDPGDVSIGNHETEDIGNISHNEGVHADSDASGKKKLQAQFGRKRTHNEQIMVAPCGMILSRATFFGAEAVSTVVVCLLSIVFLFITSWQIRNSSNEPSASMA
jgi:hypothetical protein